MQKPRYIDIHAHTNFTAFDADRREVVERALSAGVWMINIGTQRDTSRRAAEMAHEFSEGVYAIVGLHPIHVNPSFHDADEIGPETKPFESRGEDFDAAYYRDLIARAPRDATTGKSKVVGIGECGLDYYRALTETERTRQIQAFKGQIELALELGLPLMLHIRSGEGGDAYRDVLDILKEYKNKAGDKLRGDAHFFAGSEDDLRGFLDLGFHVSYTGAITFPPRKSGVGTDYAALIRATPLDRIMSETDCPYVAPVPERGKRNEPSFVIHTASKIIGIKGADPEDGRERLVANACKLFGL